MSGADNFNDVTTAVSKGSFAETALGRIGAAKAYALDQALRFALDIRY